MEVHTSSLYCVSFPHPWNTRGISLSLSRVQLNSVSTQCTRTLQASMPLSLSKSLLVLPWLTLTLSPHTELANAPRASTTCDHQLSWSDPPFSRLTIHPGFAVFIALRVCVCLCAQSYSTFGDPHGLSPARLRSPWTFQARILERVVISSSRISSTPTDWTYISCISCIGRWNLSYCATWACCL